MIYLDKVFQYIVIIDFFHSEVLHIKRCNLHGHCKNKINNRDFSNNTV